MVYNITGEIQVSLLIAFLILGALAYGFLTYQNRCLQRVLSSDAVLVNGAQDRYPTLPLGAYGVPHRFHSPNRIQVVFPKLAESGEVEYIYSWHNLAAVQPVSLSRSHPQIKIRIMAELAPVIKDHLRLEVDTIALEKQYLKLNKLADLVSTSDLYSPQLGVYERAIDETEKLMKKVEELSKVYIRIVRETLIGIRLAEFDPDSLLDLHIPLDEQYNRVKSEYELMKDTAHAYFELLKESKGIKGL
jgi:hypothetical protein